MQAAEWQLEMGSPGSLLQAQLCAVSISLKDQKGRSLKTTLMRHLKTCSGLQPSFMAKQKVDCFSYSQ